jgi:NADPH-dependent 2,4-dienoyl-CoA reductase/sulfur reductase-like enzyme
MTAMARASSAAFQVETAVIGAGVIGLAIARSLAMAGKEVIILDRANAIGSGAFSVAV